MKRRVSILIIFFIAVAAVVAALAITHFSLSALNEPGNTEIYLATKAKHFLIARASRAELPAQPPVTTASIAEGEQLYGTECAMCHGINGYTATDSGRWMYPRAADLTSAAVQQYSDRELFWIVKNGIRLSGMPAFGKVESDQHMWELAQYVRQLKTGRTP